MLFSLNANALTSMLARMCSNWLKFRFHCKNGSTFSFYFNPRESPFLSNANFVILPHQGHIKSVLVCGTLFEKKGCWELVRSLRLKQFLYTTGGLLVITYLLAWVHSKWKIGSFFLHLHGGSGGHRSGQRRVQVREKATRDLLIFVFCKHSPEALTFLWEWKFFDHFMCHCV